jgi:hypothetical protein
MNRRYLIANSILWATAIIASAVLRAPASLTLVLLPCLAACSWLAALPGSAERGGPGEASSAYDSRC